MSKQPKTSVGELGETRITAAAEGQTIEIVHSNLPTNKEQLEKLFAEKFVEPFNRDRLGLGNPIDNIEQKDTSDLDFKIKSGAAERCFDP